MFTGIIEGKAIVHRVEKKGGKVLFEIELPRRVAGSLKTGSSLAVNGACLTVVTKKGNKVAFNLLQETMKRTSLGSALVKAHVNVERPLKTGSRIDGHFVLGHVDGLGRVEKILSKGAEKNFVISYPKNLKRFFVEKGSVAVDGISLTLGKVTPAAFWIHCIPHTLKSTNLSTLRVGDRVNLEADLLAKLILKK